MTPGGTFYVDGASVLYLVGSIMDWSEDDFAAGFVFENPNATGSCGCGEALPFRRFGKPSKRARISVLRSAGGIAMRLLIFVCKPASAHP